MNGDLTSPVRWVSIEVTTDEELVASIRRGDRAALGGLAQIYYSRLVWMLRRLLLQDATIDEVINETFVAVWRSARDLDERTRASTWIIGIACRLAIQALRITATRVIRPDDQISAALLRLPLEQRLTVTLAYQMRLSIFEIGQITRSPAATVHARMALARTNLRAS
jgi:RNA polymerase sigma-70 factor, ECF subfamily